MEAFILELSRNRPHHFSYEPRPVSGTNISYMCTFGEFQLGYRDEIVYVIAGTKILTRDSLSCDSENS